MEYMEKGSLRDVLVENIRNKNPFSLTAIVTIMYYIAKGMDHLHSINIIHRDLKVNYSLQKFFLRKLIGKEKKNSQKTF